MPSHATTRGGNAAVHAPGRTFCRPCSGRAQFYWPPTARSAISLRHVLLRHYCAALVCQPPFRLGLGGYCGPRLLRVEHGDCIPWHQWTSGGLPTASVTRTIPLGHAAVLSSRGRRLPVQRRTEGVAAVNLKHLRQSVPLRRKPSFLPRMFHVKRVARLATFREAT